MDKKIKVFTLSDMPLSPSGVGTQTRYICEALLKTGKFQIRSFGGAIKHPKYTNNLQFTKIIMKYIKFKNSKI